MRTPNMVASMLLVSTVTTLATAGIVPKDMRQTGFTAVLECNVDGEDSPEAALRQVDPHALMVTYCATGCDYAVNQATQRPHVTYIKPICSVEKIEKNVEQKKYTSKDDKEALERRTLQPQQERGQNRRDIDAYTIGSATLKFSCMDPDGVDYTENAAKRIGLELSICKWRT